jgi:hypothetical protein
MRYSTAPAYDPKTGTYRGKGNGSKGKKIPSDGAAKIGRSRSASTGRFVSTSKKRRPDKDAQ